jgi:hypothetical protein
METGLIGFTGMNKILFLDELVVMITAYASLPPGICSSD